MTFGRIARRVAKRAPGLTGSQMNRIVLASLAAFLLFCGDAALAETETEGRIRELVQKKPGASLVFIDVRLVDEDLKHDPHCQEIAASVTSDEGYEARLPTQYSPSFFGNKLEGG